LVDLPLIKPSCVAVSTTWFDADEQVDVLAILELATDGALGRDVDRDRAPKQRVGGDGLVGAEDRELGIGGGSGKEVGRHLLIGVDRHGGHAAHDGVRLTVRLAQNLVDRDLAQRDVVSGQRGARWDVARRDEHRLLDHGGGVAAIRREPECAIAGGQRKRQAETDQKQAPPTTGVLELHLHALDRTDWRAASPRPRCRARAVPRA
jgi:hypothetical protein